MSGKTVDGIWGQGMLTLLWTKPGFVQGNEANASTDYVGTMPGKRQGLGATWLWSAQQGPQVGLEGLGGDPAALGHRKKEMATGLFLCCPGLHPETILSLQNIFYFF